MSIGRVGQSLEPLGPVGRISLVGYSEPDLQEGHVNPPSCQLAQNNSN